MPSPGFTDSEASQSPERLWQPEEDPQWVVIGPMRRSQPNAKPRAQAKFHAAPEEAASSRAAPRDPVQNDANANSGDEGGFSQPVVDNQGFRPRYVSKTCQDVRDWLWQTTPCGLRLFLNTQVSHPAKLKYSETCECLQRVGITTDVLVDEDSKLHLIQICPQIAGVIQRKLNTCQLCLEKGALFLR